MSPMVAGRLLWLLLAIGGVLLCAPWLDRAAASCEKPRARRASGSGRTLRFLDLLMAPLQSTQLGTLVAAELQLTLRQRPGWWWLALLSDRGRGDAGADASSRRSPSSAGWALLLDRYGQAPLYERSTRTGPLIFSASGAGKRSCKPAGPCCSRSACW